MMIAVSDSSPLMNLAIVDQLSLLPAVFDAIVVPRGVIAELRLDTNLPGAECLRAVLADGWLRTERVTDAVAVEALRSQLDQGESEAIVLARELGIRHLLIDERAGRRVALLHGLQPVGLVGVLLAAKRLGVVPCIEPVLQALRDQAGFRLSEALVDRALRKCGER